MTSDRDEYADEYQEASNFALLEESIRADERQRLGYDELIKSNQMWFNEAKKQAAEIERMKSDVRRVLGWEHDTVDSNTWHVMMTAIEANRAAALDERQRVLAGCWRCGASADDAIFHWNPDTGAEPAWCGECGTDGAHPYESIASALARLAWVESLGLVKLETLFRQLDWTEERRAHDILGLHAAEERVMVLEEALRSIADERLGSSPDTYAMLKGRARAALTRPVELRQHRIKDGEPIPPVEQWPPVEGEG